jgi:nitrite reductase (NADH) large subunit
MTTTKNWQCSVCGYVHKGEEPPRQCPVCGVDADLFSEMAAIASRERPSTAPAANAQATGGGFSGRILIVGAGVAGITAAESAREIAPAAAITVVSAEPGAPYLRLNLTRFLAGEVDAASLAMKEPAWFAENRIEIAHGDVVDLGLGDRRALLRDGRALPWERLVIAAGAHAFVPPFPGATRGGVHVLRTLADATAILGGVARGTRAVCVGGGLLGLEAAGALARRGAHVSVLEGWGWLLPRQLPERGGRLLAEALAATGIRVVHGAKVKEIAGDEKARAVVLESGEEHPADLVLLATGVRPNSWLARRAGIKVDAGAVVDDGMRTSAAGVFAAGDVAEHRGTVYGIWPAAYATGQVAGINAAGGAAEMGRMPLSNRIKVLGVDLFSVGAVSPTDGNSRVFDEEPRPGVFRRLVTHDGALIGAALYGDTAAADLVKAAIETGAQIEQSPALLAALPAFARAMGLDRA